VPSSRGALRVIFDGAHEFALELDFAPAPEIARSDKWGSPKRRSNIRAVAANPRLIEGMRTAVVGATDRLDIDWFAVLAADASKAYLHPGVLEVVHALRAAGIRPGLTTGGRGITEALARDLAQAGLHTVSVSLDGLEATHDLMRASPGSFVVATAALRHLKAAGLRIASNLNLNRLNRGLLEPLAAHLRTLGISAWQVQLTAPLGRAADRPAMLLQPWDLLTLVPRLAALKKTLWNEARISLQPGNNPCCHSRARAFAHGQARPRELPDVRDGLTRLERVVLTTLQTLQRERGGRSVSSMELYGRVVEQINVSQAEFQAVLARLGGR
jgi:hypothetical protein